MGEGDKMSPQITQQALLELVQKDLQAHAKTISELTLEAAEMKTWIAVRDERDKHILEQISNVNKKLDNLTSIGRYLLLAFFASIIAAAVTFVVERLSS